MGNKAGRSKSHNMKPAMSSPSKRGKRKRIISTNSNDSSVKKKGGDGSKAVVVTSQSSGSLPHDSLMSIGNIQAEECKPDSGGGRGGSGLKDDDDRKYTNGELIDQLCSGKKVSAADFELLKVIGRGSFGKVMQVRHKETSKIYAMKTMRKGNIIAKNQVAHTKDEKHILQRIKHPFIVNLNYAFQTKDKLYMILDYVNGGELFWHLKKEGSFGEERSKFYAAEIASALFHLHQNGIIYRDLKPENLLLDSEGHIVITDFGLSKEIRDTPTHTFCGTPEYLAPEVLLGTGHSYPVDWWSLGTLVYEMITGLPPFYSEDKREMYGMILNKDLIFPHDMSEEACDFLLGMLEKNPQDRLTPNEIQEHPWFSGLDWEALIQKKLEPPWKPHVNGPLDTSQIDPQILKEQPFDSHEPNRGPLDLSEGDQALFAGFTYEGEAVGGSVLAATVSGNATNVSL
eukprot:TRINITY_DN18176_c0_g1_i1.p1 TRINITY_DN18176_c0_g1~~TRINITY_DN18176_c0_g1_i1.p1  ORF type:complete len:456 (+),score=79.70 TRINITY_DN18176_c0_g1_i1:78-1445(+)